MSNYLTACRIKARSINARNLVNIRWAAVRAAQAVADAADPLRFAGALRCRVIVIPTHGQPRETCFYSFDSDAHAGRKQRAIVRAIREAYQ